MIFLPAGQRPLASQLHPGGKGAVVVVEGALVVVTVPVVVCDGVGDGELPGGVGVGPA